MKVKQAVISFFLRVVVGCGGVFLGEPPAADAHLWCACVGRRAIRSSPAFTAFGCFGGASASIPLAGALSHHGAIRCAPLRKHSTCRNLRRFLKTFVGLIIRPNIRPKREARESDGSGRAEARKKWRSHDASEGLERTARRRAAGSHHGATGAAARPKKYQDLQDCRIIRLQDYTYSLTTYYFLLTTLFRRI